MNNEVNVNLEDCWCRDLPIEEAMELTGASRTVVVETYIEFDNRMNASFFSKGD